MKLLETLARIDERLKAIQTDVAEIKKCRLEDELRLRAVESITGIHTANLNTAGEEILALRNSQAKWAMADTLLAFVAGIAAFFGIVRQ